MASYKEPVKGKLGIRSHISKRMCFGICCDTKKECLDELRDRVGYYDSFKYRFHTSSWSESDMLQHQEYLKEMAEWRKSQREERKYRKECAKWINEHKSLLKEEFLERLENKSWINVKVKKEALKMWLTMPERVKEEVHE